MAKVTVNFNKASIAQNLDPMATLDPFVIRDKLNGELIVAFKTSYNAGKTQLIYIQPDGLVWDYFEDVKNKYEVVDIKAEVNIQVN